MEHETLNSLITGGAGFIGSHLADVLLQMDNKVIVLDSLSYAADLNNIQQALSSSNCHFVEGSILDSELVSSLLLEYEIDRVYHLAAESHVDNSIREPGEFIQSNIVGTYQLLIACQNYLNHQSSSKDFRFIHVSTDEVFGHLKDDDKPFTENHPYAPNSPYSASKASSDMLVRAWHRTYKFPAIITNCSNNFGPRQNREKLIPSIIHSAVNNLSIKIYGTGQNIRDWLYVKDHCYGLVQASAVGQIGEIYCLGGDKEITNIELAYQICDVLDELENKVPEFENDSYRNLITFVEDRKGHDWRYAVDFSKARRELGFTPNPNFKAMLKETVCYYHTLYKSQQNNT